MKAVMYYGKHDVRLEEVPAPPLLPDSVRIRPAYNGICGSDLHLYHDGPSALAPTAEVPHPLSGETLPVVLGHEFSGTVMEVGEEVVGLEPGDAVVVEPLLVDGTCAACLSGSYNLCHQLGFIGISGGGGGLSEQVVVPRRWVHPVGDMPLDEAALIEPLAVAVHAVRHARAKQGQTAVVGGAGPIGLLTAAVLKAYGVSAIVSEVSGLRREIAASTGVANQVVDPAQDDLSAVVAEATGGAGADLAFDAAGAGGVVSQLFHLLGARGRLEVVAVHKEPFALDISAHLMRHDREVGSSLAYAGDHTEAIELARNGRVRLSDFITSRIRAEEIVEKGLERLITDRDSEVKILVSMS
ncbi:2,3-butanediol dehydrogenase [Brevibacterium sp. NPDC049920]|uniref:2,3-butanediol dehydrogenase n=1 Tax=Brevibacterium sp. NPDC049920 TaxID=3155279 RepID=UPI0025FC83AC|nr:2,3-butanediol dehydrogenase [uncultured Brevibacterium sp.]